MPLGFTYYGYGANHFTINVNELKSIENLAEFNELLKEQGFVMNSSGGEIKGSKGVMLQQSSILADKMNVFFKEGHREAPSCYYEFAERFPMDNGELYSGFVAKLADKICESTDNKVA